MKRIMFSKDSVNAQLGGSNMFICVSVTRTCMHILSLDTYNIPIELANQIFSFHFID